MPSVIRPTGADVVAFRRLPSLLRYGLTVPEPGGMLRLK